MRASVTACSRVQISAQHYFPHPQSLESVLMSSPGRTISWFSLKLNAAFRISSSEGDVYVTVKPKFENYVNI
jgi:hypothetical protein